MDSLEVAGFWFGIVMAAGGVVAAGVRIHNRAHARIGKVEGSLGALSARVDAHDGDVHELQTQQADMRETLGEISGSMAHLVRGFDQATGQLERFQTRMEGKLDVVTGRLDNVRDELAVLRSRRTGRRGGD